MVVDFEIALWVLLREAMLGVERREAITEYGAWTAALRYLAAEVAEFLATQRAPQVRRDDLRHICEAARDVIPDLADAPLLDGRLRRAYVELTLAYRRLCMSRDGLVVAE